MARTGKRPARTFVFPVTEHDGSIVEGCTVEYSRDTGYSAFFQGRIVGTADSKYEAELVARQARSRALEVTQ